MEKRNQRQSARKRKAPSLVADYRLIPGVPDEMVGPDGAIRPAWTALIEALDELGHEEMAARFERADQYLRDAGVYYRKYDGAEGKERAWPLAHLPLILDEAEWKTITTGLTQRASTATTTS
jgi:uncharacterized circularly permuted ATP-grasp superfamily protein